MMFQATPWGVMGRAWKHPEQGVSHRAGAEKKKARKMKQASRRKNRR